MTLAYMVVSLFTIVASSVYGLLGHGVSSPAMTYMFLYPLIGGALPALPLWLLAGRGRHVPQSRVAYNLYNAGIATLTVGSFLVGVLEIAGTASTYTFVMRLIGAGLVVAALAMLLVSAGRSE